MPTKLEEIPEITFHRRRDLLVFEILDMFFPDLPAATLANLALPERSGVKVDDNKVSRVIVETAVEIETFNESRVHEIYLEECIHNGRVPSFSFSATPGNHPFSKLMGVVDFALWAKAAYWTSDECVALSLGKSPEIFNTQSISKSPVRRHQMFAKEYFRRKELVDRAVAVGVIPENVPPTEFVQWARKLNLDVSVELLAELDLINDSHRDAVDAPGKPLQEKERDSLLKLILGMSVDKYGYGIGETRNDATGNKSYSITSRLAGLGIELDSDTIRKYLKEAEQRFGDLVNPPK